MLCKRCNLHLTVHFHYAPSVSAAIPKMNTPVYDDWASLLFLIELATY